MAFNDSRRIVKPFCVSSFYTCFASLNGYDISVMTFIIFFTVVSVNFYPMVFSNIKILDVMRTRNFTILQNNSGTPVQPRLTVQFEKFFC